MKKYKILSLFLSLLLIIGVFNSCSYVEFENKLQTPASNQSQEAPFKDVLDIRPDPNTKFKHIGEEIVVNDGLAELSYTITGMTVYNHFTAAGLKQEDLKYVGADADLANPFVLVEVTVSNKKIIQETEFYNIGVFHLLNQELFSDPWKKSLPEISYFSAFKSLGSDYLHYTLSEGEEMHCQLGWILADPVSTADHLILHVGADIKLNNYVDLSSENATAKEA